MVSDWPKTTWLKLHSFVQYFPHYATKSRLRSRKSWRIRNRKFRKFRTASSAAFPRLKRRHLENWLSFGTAYEKERKYCRKPIPLVPLRKLLGNTLELGSRECPPRHKFEISKHVISANDFYIHLYILTCTNAPTEIPIFKKMHIGNNFRIAAHTLLFTINILF